jgi:hypothetical protein
MGGVKRDSVTRVTPRICIFFIFVDVRPVGVFGGFSVAKVTV